MDVRQLIESVRDQQVPLLDSGEATAVPLWLQTWWIVTHFLGFFTGGTTFIAGTLCYYYPDWHAGALVAGVLYTVGSFGFLYVDVLEFFTFTEDAWLRTNIAMSAFGSTWYVISGCLNLTLNPKPGH